LVSCILSHLNACFTDYSWVVGAWLRLHSEELSEQDPIGLDFDECFAEVHEYRDVENTIGVQIQVLNTVVLEKTLEEIAGGSASPRSMNLTNIGTSSRFFSMGVARGGAPHVHLLLPQEPAIHQG
jgi:hypothetical protein